MYCFVAIILFMIFTLTFSSCNKSENNNRRSGPSGSVTNPETMKVVRELGNMTGEGSGWRSLLIEIAESGKYVDLDLSECIMSGTEFNPDARVSTGKHLIVSLILPNDARSIAAGENIDSRAFRHFTELTEVVGLNITTIGNRAFRGDTSENSTTKLRSVTFPASVNVGDYVFAGCTSLTNFNLTGIGPLSVIESGKVLVRNETELVAYPSASGNIVMPDITSIGQGAFSFCVNLTGVNFPFLTNIGQGAFSGCYSLSSVVFPLAINIGNNAFSNCPNLTAVDFPVATSIGARAFSGCTGLAEMNLPLITNLGEGVFNSTGTTILTITFGVKAPSIATHYSGGMFDDVTERKSVTVRIPNGATGYGSVRIGEGAISTTWGDIFRGIRTGFGGWAGYYIDSLPNPNIVLGIEQYEEEPAYFPSDFVGTWVRNNFSNMLTFTTNTLKASNQSYTWNLRKISGDSFTISTGESNYNGSIIIKLVGSSLEISGDSGTDQDNWNGTWIKQ
jgi:hypothetical protein